MYDPAQATVGCAAAELGELALRRKLLVRSRKGKTFGLDSYHPRSAEIQLLDASRTNVSWIDELLAKLEGGSGTGHGGIRLNRWLRQRREALSLHREALITRGLLHPKPGGRPGHIRFLGRRRYYPDHAARDAVIAEVRAAISGPSRCGEHAIFLHDLAMAARLGKEVGHTLSLRQRLGRARGAGGVGNLPEDLRDTTAVLSLRVSMSASADN